MAIDMPPRVERAATVALPTGWGDFTLYGYTAEGLELPYLVAVMGDVTGVADVLVRVHSCCATGDIFHSRRCDCGQQFDLAMQTIAAAGSGVMVYATDHEGRGIGLLQKLKAYELQERGLDTIEANTALGHEPDERDYGIAAAVLLDLGVWQARLMTNNPDKIGALRTYGIEISEHVPLIVEPVEQNRLYLETKRVKTGHMLPALEFV